MLQLEQENENNIPALLIPNLQTHSSPSLSNRQSISIPSNISNIFSSSPSSSSITSNISTTSDISFYTLPPSSSSQQSNIQSSSSSTTSTTTTTINISFSSSSVTSNLNIEAPDLLRHLVNNQNHERFQLLQQPLKALIKSIQQKIDYDITIPTKTCPECHLPFQSLSSHRPGCKKCIVDK